MISPALQHGSMGDRLGGTFELALAGGTVAVAVRVR